MRATAKRKATNAKAKNKKSCMHTSCKNEIKAEGFCRLHYIANWRAIQFNRKVRAERRLNAYVDAISKKYPKDFVDKIREGLSDTDKFKSTITELNFDMHEHRYDDSEVEFVERFLRKVKGE